MDKFVFSRLLESINLGIQTALQVSRPIRPLQIILGEIHVNYHTYTYFISGFSSYLDHSVSQN